MKSEMVDHSKLIQLFDDIEMKDSDEQLTEVNEQASGEIEVENTDKAQAETKEQPTEQETTQTDEQTEEAAAPTPATAPASAPEPAKAAVQIHKFNPDEVANQKAEEEEKQFKTLSKADKQKHFEQSRNEGLL